MIRTMRSAAVAGCGVLGLELDTLVRPGRDRSARTGFRGKRKASRRAAHPKTHVSRCKTWDIRPPDLASLPQSPIVREEIQLSGRRLKNGRMRGNRASPERRRVIVHHSRYVSPAPN